MQNLKIKCQLIPTIMFEIPTIQCSVPSGPLHMEMKGFKNQRDLNKFKSQSQENICNIHGKGCVRFTMHSLKDMVLQISARKLRRSKEDMLRLITRLSGGRCITKRRKSNFVVFLSFHVLRLEMECE